jgi:hypothetical protein
MGRQDRFFGRIGTLEIPVDPSSKLAEVGLYAGISETGIAAKVAMALIPKVCDMTNPALRGRLKIKGDQQHTPPITCINSFSSLSFFKNNANIIRQPEYSLAFGVRLELELLIHKIQHCHQHPRPRREYLLIKIVEFG